MHITSSWFLGVFLLTTSLEIRRDRDGLNLTIKIEHSFTDFLHVIKVTQLLHM